MRAGGNRGHASCSINIRRGARVHGGDLEPAQAAHGAAGSDTALPAYSNGFVFAWVREKIGVSTTASGRERWGDQRVPTGLRFSNVTVGTRVLASSYELRMRIVSVAVGWRAPVVHRFERRSSDHSPARASGEMSSASLVAPVAVARRAASPRHPSGWLVDRHPRLPRRCADRHSGTITPAISVCARLPPPTTKTPCP